MCYCYQGSKMGSLMILCHSLFILVPSLGKLYTFSFICFDSYPVTG